MNPLELNDLYLLDALVYDISFDAMTASAVVCIEVEPAYHKGVERLTRDMSASTLLIDFLFIGAHAVRADHLPARPPGWAADEKPHNYEIDTVRVRKIRSRYQVEITCRLGQTISIEFDDFGAQRSRRTAGVVREYPLESNDAIRPATPRHVRDDE